MSGASSKQAMSQQRHIKADTELQKAAQTFSHDARNALAIMKNTIELLKLEGFTGTNEQELHILEEQVDRTIVLLQEFDHIRLHTPS